MRKFLIFLLVICTIFLCFVIPSFADEGISTLADTPTDLAGYTVTVPAGWTATAGYGSFSLDFKINGSSLVYSYLYVGYSLDYSGPFPVPTSSSNSACCLFEDTVTGYDISSSFVLSDISGSDASNTSLIQWLVDNNATFENNNVDPNPAVTLSAGNYYFNPSISFPYFSEWFDDGYTYSYSADGYYFVGSLPHHFNVFNYQFKSLTDDQNYHLVFSVDTDSGEVVPLYDIFCVNGRYTVDTLDGLTYFSLEEDVVLDLNSRTTFEHFFKTYAPDTPVFDGNPWSYILEMVIEALKVKIWGYFSVWDIVTTLCGIFIATWLLKLLAGG